MKTKLTEKPYMSRLTKRALGPARGAYSLAKGRGLTDRSAHGLAQEAAAQVLGTKDGTYEIADYAEAYWMARNVEKTSMVEAERCALAVYAATVQAMAMAAVEPEEGWNGQRKP